MNNANEQAKKMNKIIQDLRNGNRNNKECTKGDNPEVRKLRKDMRNHRCKYHQQNGKTEERISGAEVCIKT